LVAGYGTTTGPDDGHLDIATDPARIADLLG